MPLHPDENKSAWLRLFRAIRKRPLETGASLVIVGVFAVISDEVKETTRALIFDRTDKTPVFKRSVSVEERAAAFVSEYAKAWSLPNELAVAKVVEMYAPEVDFYGKPHDFNDLFFVKADFVERWPIRDYRVVPDTVSVLCDGVLCYFHGDMTWYTRSDERNAQASGVAHVEITLQWDGDSFLIVAEGSGVTERD